MDAARSPHAPIPEARVVHTSRGELAVCESGSGDPLVFLHGFPLDHTMWREQIAEFSSRGRVIAPDLRGFGKSPPASPLSIESMADDTAAILDALGVRGSIVLCGLSMGGYVAFQFWRKYRERLRALVLCDTRAVADTPEAAQGRREQMKRVRSEGVQPVATAMIGKLFAPQTVDNQAQLVERERNTMLSADPAGVAAALEALATRPDVSDYLPEIACPTLVVVGQHDSISPVAEMRTLAAAIPNAEFVALEDCGHMSPLENPRAFNAVLQGFLNRVQKA
jgi:pimeloyl-ACP methyl ester carboxylesterase